MFTYLQQLPVEILYIYLGVFSLLVGSLLNVFIYRLPIMLRNEWIKDCQQLLNCQHQLPVEKINLFFPRSFCPNCKKTIPFYYNIPLFSFFLLRRACPFCRQKISWRYPIVEFTTCLLSLFAFYKFGLFWGLPFILIFLWVAIILLFIDLEQQILPDNLTLSLLWLGLIANTAGLFIPLANAVLSSVCAYLFLWLFIQFYYLCSGKIGMGHGDFKLFAAFAAWFGWMMLPFILLASSVTGAIFGLLYLYRQNKNKDTPIPFGPFLIISAIIALFWGPQMIQWYLNFW